MSDKKSFPSNWDSRRTSERDEHGKRLPPYAEKPIHGMKMDSSHYKTSHNPTRPYSQNHSQSLRGPPSKLLRGYEIFASN